MASVVHLIADLDYGGAQTQLLCLARAGAARGDRVTVASLARPGPVGSELAESRVIVVWLKRRFSFDPIALGKLSRLLAREKPDAVQTWDLESGLYARFGFSGDGWVHTVREAERPLGWRGAAERLVLSHACGIIAPDATIADRLVEGGVERDRVSVVPNTCLPTESGIDKDRVRWKLCRVLELGEQRGPLIGMVGRWDTMSRGKEAIWAADLVQVVRRRAIMVCVGSGRCVAHYARFARKANAPGVVRFMGNREDWPELVRGFDLLWAPNANSSLSTPMVEALAAGVPAVVARTPERDQLFEAEPFTLTTDWNHRAGWVRATERLLVGIKAEGSLIKAEGSPEISTEASAPGITEWRLPHSLERAAEAHRRALGGSGPPVWSES